MFVGLPSFYKIIPFYRALEKNTSIIRNPMPAGGKHQADCSGSADSRNGAAALEGVMMRCGRQEELWGSLVEPPSAVAESDEEHDVVCRGVSPEQAHRDVGTLARLYFPQTLNERGTWHRRVSRCLFPAHSFRSVGDAKCHLLGRCKDHTSLLRDPSTCTALISKM